MTTRTERMTWRCVSCYSSGDNIVHWSEGGARYRLRQDGTRGARIGLTSVWNKWITDRFGPQVACVMCGTIVDPDQIETLDGARCAEEDVRFELISAEAA